MQSYHPIDFFLINKNGFFVITSSFTILVYWLEEKECFLIDQKELPIDDQKYSDEYILKEDNLSFQFDKIGYNQKKVLNKSNFSGYLNKIGFNDMEWTITFGKSSPWMNQNE